MADKYPKEVKSDDLRDMFDSDTVDMLGSHGNCFQKTGKTRGPLKYKLDANGFDLLSSLRLNAALTTSIKALLF